MKLPLTIKVTKTDIDKGWNGGSYSCPINRAVARASKMRMGSVGVSIDSVWLKSERFNLPKNAAKFSTRQSDWIDERGQILKHKALKKLKPFSFELTEK